MLEIKFKAWSKLQKKMYQVDAIDFSGGTIRKGDPCFVEDKQNGGCFLLENSILLQYTGIQDSKGNDVYDGDILAYPDNFEDKSLFKVQWMKAYSGFQWCECQIRLSDGRPVDDDEPYDFYGGVNASYKTIVGNIYEFQRDAGKVP